MCIEGGGEEGNYGARAAPKGHDWGSDTAGPSEYTKVRGFSPNYVYFIDLTINTLVSI